MIPTVNQRHELHALMRGWADDYGPSLYTDLTRDLRVLQRGEWWQVKPDAIAWEFIFVLRGGHWSRWTENLDAAEESRVLATIENLYVVGTDEEVAEWALEWLIPPPDRR